MKIYSIRDKLIGYFMKPFMADSNNQVLAALAAAINQEDNRDPIAQTPNHFEIWLIGTFNEDTGKIVNDPLFLGDCSGLVRDRVRENDADRSRADAMGGPQESSRDQARRPGGLTIAEQRPLTDTLEGGNGQGAQKHRSPVGTA